MAETAIRDRYDRLTNLMATMGDKGELPLAMALANVVSTSQQVEEMTFCPVFGLERLMYTYILSTICIVIYHR